MVVINVVWMFWCCLAKNVLIGEQFRIYCSFAAVAAASMADF